jgi:hypothetical protein
VEVMLWISKAFPCDETGPQSTLNALLCAVVTEIESERIGAWSPPSLEPTKEVAISMDKSISQDPSLGSGISDLHQSFRSRL